MSEEKTSEKKLRNKKDPRLVENDIYQIGPNLFDVKVRKRIKEKLKVLVFKKQELKKHAIFK